MVAKRLVNYFFQFGFFFTWLSPSDDDDEDSVDGDVDLGISFGTDGLAGEARSPLMTRSGVGLFDCKRTVGAMDARR